MYIHTKNKIIVSHTESLFYTAKSISLAFLIAKSLTI